MEEILVSFEVAKLFKEKGFNWKTLYRYQGDKDYITGGSLYNHNDLEEQKLWNIGLYSAPTLSLAQKWLREVHNIHINVYPNSGNEGDASTVWYYSYISRYDNSLHDDAFNCISDDECDTYEEALEEGIKQVLLLINNKN